MNRIVNYLTSAILLCGSVFTVSAQTENGQSIAERLRQDSLLLQAAIRGEAEINLPLFQTKYTADPSPIVVGDTLFLFTSHDASPEDIPDENEKSSAGFFMYDWLPPTWLTGRSMVL